MTIETRNVVSMQNYRNRPVHAALSQIEDYWTGLRGSRLVPARADIDPRAISQSLEYAFILERVAKGLGRFRLAGMHLNDLMGMEVRGMPLTAMVLPKSRAAVSDALEGVFDEPAIVRMTLRSPASMGRPPLEAQLLLLPLRSDLGDVSRVLGCLVSDGKMGRAPRRFDVVEESRRTLIGYGDVRSAPAAAETEAVETSSGEDTAALASTEATSGVPHLRLVTSD